MSSSHGGLWWQPYIESPSVRELGLAKVYRKKYRLETTSRAPKHFICALFDKSIKFCT